MLASNNNEEMEMKIEMKQRMKREQNNRMLASIWTNSRWKKTKRMKKKNKKKNTVDKEMYPRVCKKKWDKAPENPHRFIFCMEMVVVLCWHDHSIHQDKKNENKILLKI